jgi:hypothetical protein
VSENDENDSGLRPRNPSSERGGQFHAGRPFGKEEFIVRLEEHFQRKWRRWSFEKSAVAG